MVTIGGIDFSSQKAARLYAQEYLRQRVNRQFKPHDVPWLMALLKRHERWDEKSKHGVAGILIKRSISTKSFGCDVLIIGDRGERTSISWNFCITGNKKTHDRRHYRTLVADVIERYRAYNILPNGNTCGLCGVSGLHKDQMHVDHVYPFSKMVDEYEALTVKPAFADFHNNHSKLELQVLCAKCNVAKGNTT